MFVNGLPLVVVFRVRLPVGAGDGLGGFIGFEAQVAFLVRVRAGFVAESGVAEHQVVVGLQVFGINRQCLLEFLHGAGIALLQKENAAKLVDGHAVARILG